MEEHGKIIAVLNPQTGTSPRTGQSWYSQSYVLEIDGRYTRRVCFNLWSLENNEKAALVVGQYITMLGEVEAHEFQGKWFNEVRAYDIIKNGRSVLRGVPTTYSPASNAAQTAIPTNQYAQPAPAAVPTMQAQTAIPTNQYAQPAPAAVPSMQAPNAIPNQPMPEMQYPPINPATGLPY